MRLEQPRKNQQLGPRGDRNFILSTEPIKRIDGVRKKNTTSTIGKNIA